MTKTLSHDDKSQWLETIWKALRSHRENSARIGVSEHDQEWLGICKAMALVTEELVLKQMPAGDYLSLNQGLEGDVGSIDIKAWRKARKITQEQAADILGVSPRQIQRLEAGTNRLTPTLVKLMAQL